MHRHLASYSVSDPRRPGAARVGVVLGAAVLLAGLATLLAAAAVTSWGMVSDGGAARPDEVVVLVLGTVGALVAAWLAFGALVSLATALAGGAQSRLVPMTVHVMVATILGVGLAPAAWASDAAGRLDPVPVPTSTSAAVDPGWGADPAPTPRASLATPASPAPAAAETVDPGWLPAAPTPAPRVASPAETVLLGSPRPSVASQEEIVVRRGDTLWDLAARHLGPGAGDAEIAAEWPRWHRANLGTIGDDPDLLLPGQLLKPPT